MHDLESGMEQFRFGLKCHKNVLAIPLQFTRATEDPAGVKECVTVAHKKYFILLSLLMAR